MIAGPTRFSSSGQSLMVICLYLCSFQLVAVKSTLTGHSIRNDNNKAPILNNNNPVTNDPTSSTTTTTTTTTVATINQLIDHCEKELDFRSINDFRIFISKYKTLDESQLKHEGLPRRCRHARLAIIELEPLILNRNVCDPVHVDELVSYHKRHLAHRRYSLRSSLSTASSTSWSNEPITKKFFSRYAIQVAHVCKKNLIDNLEWGREELRQRSRVFDEAKDRVYRDEPSLKANVKLIEEQPDDPATANLKPRDDAELTLSEYREALVKLRRPEDVLTFDRSECDRSKHRRIKVDSSKINTFFKPALMCHQLARFYAGSILSIAKLANIGYSANDDELDLKLSDNPMIRDWIIAVQVCEPMMYMRSEGSSLSGGSGGGGSSSSGSNSINGITGSGSNGGGGGNGNNEGGIAIVDTCAERVSSIEEMVFEDNFDDFDNEHLDEMIPRSEATREHAQILMRSAMKKMAKANLMKQLAMTSSKTTATTTTGSSSQYGIKKRGIFGKSIELLGATFFNSQQAPNVASKFSLTTTTTSANVNSRLDMSHKVAEQLVRSTLESSTLIPGATALAGSSSSNPNTGSPDWQPDDKTVVSLIEMFDRSSASTDVMKQGSTGVERSDEDQAVSVFDPVTSLASFVTVIAIMLTFEWLFFIVMTLAARICHRLYFNFDNILTFPPKVLSWSDADFAKFNDRVDKLDEDDLLDYDELNPDEQRQRDLLANVFGKPPPMIFRE